MHNNPVSGTNFQNTPADVNLTIKITGFQDRKRHSWTLLGVTWIPIKLRLGTGPGTFWNRQSSETHAQWGGWGGTFWEDAK